MHNNQIEIRLNTIEETKKFISLTNKMPNVMDISRGRFLVDAKSLMGLFSLDLNEPLVLTIYGDLNPTFEYELRKFEVIE